MDLTSNCFVLCTNKNVYFIIIVGILGCAVIALIAIMPLSYFRPESSSSTVVVLGVIVGLLGLAVIALVVFTLYMKRRKPKGRHVIFEDNLGQHMRFRYITHCWGSKS